MAPYHALDNQGVPKQRPTVPTKAASEMLSVRKDSLNATAAPHHRGDWQAGSPKQAVAPTIRVIHIFAPKVIKTDMANFRSTVQKLTGRNTKKRGTRSVRTKTPSELGVAVLPLNHPNPSPAVAAGGNFSSGLWEQESQVLQRLVGDACGTNNNPLVRSNSVDSSTYSLDSGKFSSDSNETMDGLPSPTAGESFSFYVPHRESAYSLSEIPAPFFGVDMNPCYNVTTSPSFSLHSGAEHGLGLQLPAPVMESMLSFDVENLGAGLGSPLPLSDPVGCDAPFPVLGSGGSSSGGLYDMLSVQQHCRLSVPQPTFQGGNFFEMI